MSISKEFRSTVMRRVQEDSEFRQSMLSESVNEFLSGEIDVGKAMLRDYINATISFGSLAEQLDKSSKSLQRMLGPNGNPTSKSLFDMLKVLQTSEGLYLNVQARPAN